MIVENQKRCVNDSLEQRSGTGLVQDPEFLRQSIVSNEREHQLPIPRKR